MPWLKVSDRFALHPLILGLRRVVKADDRTTNEVTGFVTRCSSLSAAYMTDYFIDLPTAEQVGLGRTDLLLRQATAAGLLAPEGRGNDRRWRIVDDEDIFHIRAREDVEWERQRQRDRRNPELTMPVMRRDGDQCRYCLVIVNWKDTRSGRGATFDHRDPSQPATVDTYVVACRTCNSKRKDNPNADLEVPIRPAPPLPYFSPTSGTRERLEEFYGQPIPCANVKRSVAGTAAAATRTSDSAAIGATRLVDTAAARPASGTADRPAAPWDAPTTAEPPWSEGGRPVGSGRERAGPGQDGAGAAVPSPRPRGKRGRRGLV